MSDFLKNLRSSQKDQSQRQQGTGRKNIGPPLQPGAERRKMADRRSPPIQSQYKISDEIKETLPFISENISQIASCIERITESQEQLAKSEAAKNSAMEMFFQGLNSFLTDNTTSGLETKATGGGVEKAPEAASESAARYTKEEIISTIKNMRKQRATFAEIASYLKEQGIPTFSGRGEWHAQTIHRLCK
ncbi:MAG: hypothetical protein R6V54_08070 [Desulfobacteraceae bacterium]